MNNNSVCVVTVTYGERWGLLDKILKKLQNNNMVKKVVVVDNGSKTDIKKACELKGYKKVLVLELGENKGSAYGFKKGIEEAIMVKECELVWLLDDDNMPHENTLEVLINNYLTLKKNHNIFALASLREDRKDYKSAAEKGNTANIFPRKNSFYGFHITDIFKKTLRKIIKLKSKQPVKCPTPIIDVPYAPYGGLFFEKRLINKIGLPNEDFYLYGDDYEFTYRINKFGGNLYLVSNSTIEDIDKSWYLEKRGNFLLSLLFNPSDNKIYYNFRNRIFFEKKDLVNNGIIYNLNKFTLLIILCFICLLTLNKKRYLLIKRAISDGEKGFLGKI
ncbi:glycosyltransferase [Bacillus sp. FJAT-27445]|uniref:glycosyltransferase n=1 Tax=Bacillus sp. FJAT-27445 TaxID=1679166 RepID=UPI000743B9EB|nr:glycosyltransferase [Bacillus sp. FJAT-27445]